jgi:hypothetical protein
MSQKRNIKMARQKDFWWSGSLVPVNSGSDKGARRDAIDPQLTLSVEDYDADTYSNAMSCLGDTQKGEENPDFFIQTIFWLLNLQKIKSHAKEIKFYEKMIF